MHIDPINCADCNLAWLIRDNRRLLKNVLYTTCSNGTRFEDLNPNGYRTCPKVKCFFVTSAILEH